jgi:cytidylate kinase
VPFGPDGHNVVREKRGEELSRPAARRARFVVPLRDVVALDGPSGTGKSTVALALATELGLRYLNTGAMYRALTWAALQDGIAPTDARALADLAACTAIEITTDPRDQRVAVDGRPVERQLRSAEVTAAVSPVSAVPEVRRRLIDAQRELIGVGGIVVEGRDIGTVVAPDAPLKVFLTAAQDTRAERRARQDGGVLDLRATVEALHRRDSYDSSRATGPLQAATDAIHVDTTTLPIDEVVKRLVDLARNRGIGLDSSPAGQARGDGR